MGRKTFRQTVANIPDKACGAESQRCAAHAEPFPKSRVRIGYARQKERKILHDRESYQIFAAHQQGQLGKRDAVIGEKAAQRTGQTQRQPEPAPPGELPQQGKQEDGRQHQQGEGDQKFRPAGNIAEQENAPERFGLQRPMLPQNPEGRAGYIKRSQTTPEGAPHAGQRLPEGLFQIGQRRRPAEAEDEGGKGQQADSHHPEMNRRKPLEVAEKLKKVGVEHQDDQNASLEVYGTVSHGAASFLCRGIGAPGEKGSPGVHYSRKNHPLKTGNFLRDQKPYGRIPDANILSRLKQDSEGTDEVAILQDKLIVRGAREHNLKNVTLEIPRNKLVVFTGLSGSGKTSLAFDTIYAEGQRRYVESLSSYARMFLGQMEKPDIDSIDGLSPAISIDQKTTARNPRSTVGTVTEIYDYLRLLYARIGVPHCPKCGREIKQQTIDQMVDQVMTLPEGQKMQVLAPVVRERKGEHAKMLEAAQKHGYVRVKIDGELYELDDLPALDKKKKHSIEIVIDRLIVRNSDEFRTRLADSLETAAKEAEGLVLVDLFDKGTMLFSQNYACPDCGVSIEELTPRMFSFNSPFGACPQCSGLGTVMHITLESIIPDQTLSFHQGALQAMAWNVQDQGSMAHTYFEALAQKYHFSLDTPVKELPKDVMDVILYGSPDKITIEYEGANGAGKYNTTFEGVIPTLERRYRETTSDAMKAGYEEYMVEDECRACHGQRLRPEVLAVTVGGLNISKVCELSVTKARAFFRSLELTEKERMIAAQILKEIDARLGFLDSVGLSYLTLSRAAATLSGGEAQRIRLATQIGSSLMGVLYILDEPSIGLHQRDNDKLLSTLKRMRDLGNTLIVVEHDEDTMYAADWIVDVGPGAGVHGGQIVAEGTVQDILDNPKSLTGQYLSGRRFIPLPEKRREPKGWLTVRGARENNLKKIDVSFPLGVFCCVTGVSGSGKSSLVNEILYKHLAKVLNRAKTYPGKFDAMEGVEQLDKIICIDQSPIGRTPRSNPATYTGVFDLIRKIFAMTPEAKARGYKENRFSFNVKGGRCEACSGDGLLKIEMHFLPDIYVPCDVCKGARYNRETLDVRYKGKNIHEVLEMTVEEALEFFDAHEPIRRKLQTLYDVGLNYIKLGQPSTQLSGGEAQRIKLATELSRRDTGRTLYLLDEPTTGLHVADVERLIGVLQRLVAAGNSVLVIEHNLDVIKTADYLIDLGPEGGDGGGKIVATGTPEEVAHCKKSYTGQYLAPILKRDRERMEKRKNERE